MSNKISIITKIKILLKGEIWDSRMNPSKIKQWFGEAFRFIEDHEKYELGSKILDAQIRWENELKKKSDNNESKSRKTQEST